MESAGPLVVLHLQTNGKSPMKSEPEPKRELQGKFEQCVDACADSLYRVAFRMTGNQTLASELVQETYLNAWRNISKLNDTNKMRGWMFAILRNQYSKQVRAETKTVAAPEHLDRVSVIKDQRKQDVDAVQDALASLDEKHRLPVLLVSMEGLSVNETADILDVPRGTVLSRLYRGRQKLKQILEIQMGPVAIRNRTVEKTDDI